MKLENLDRVIELRKRFVEADEVVGAIVGGSLDVYGYHEGTRHNVLSLLGPENIRAALRPVANYARSQIAAELAGLGVEMPEHFAAHGGKEG